MCCPPSTTGFSLKTPHNSARYVPADASQQCGGTWSTPALVARSDASCGATRLVRWRGIVTWIVNNFFGCIMVVFMYLRWPLPKKCRKRCHIAVTCNYQMEGWDIENNWKQKKKHFYMCFHNVGAFNVPRKSFFSLKAVPILEKSLHGFPTSPSSLEIPPCWWSSISTGSVYTPVSRYGKPLRQQQLPVSVTSWPCSPEWLSWRQFFFSRKDWKNINPWLKPEDV